MAVDPLQAIRDIALAFPEATEVDARGHATFRVRDKIFLSCGRTDDGAPSVSLKAAPGEQERLMARGEQFFLPPYLAAHGWVGVRLGPDTNWREIGELAIDSYREIAPRSLAATVGLAPAGQGRMAKAVIAVGNVIGELIEGKPPRDQVIAEDQVDDDHDSGLTLDPEDPGSSQIQL